MLITAFADRKMSSQLTNLVPIFNGTNYQQWSLAMQSFLMSQGQWKCTKEGADSPNVGTITKIEEDGTTTTVTTGEAKVTSWKEDAEKALGNIRLRLHHTIGYQFNEVSDPADLWEILKKKYGAPGMTKAFVEFKAIMDTMIPNGVDPSPALDKIMSHYAHLTNMDWDIPKKILAMILLSKAPSSMETIVQMYSQLLADATSEKIKADLIPEKVITMMRTSWETHGHAGTSQFNQQQANKLSAVKPAGNQPPQFQYQQQQRGGWGLGGGSKKGQRGKRGGQKNSQQQLQQATVQTEPNQQAGPSQLPPHQWVPTPTPPSYASGPANMGYFAAQMREGHPLPPTPPFSPTKSFYPHFNAAVDCQGHSTQCSQHDECLFCGQTSPTSHCQ